VGHISYIILTKEKEGFSFKQREKSGVLNSQRSFQAERRAKHAAQGSFDTTQKGAPPEKGMQTLAEEPFITKASHQDGVIRARGTTWGKKHYFGEVGGGIRLSCDRVLRLYKP